MSFTDARTQVTDLAASLFPAPLDLTNPELMVWVQHNGKILNEPAGGQRIAFFSLETAQAAALAMGSACGGITLIDGNYELRHSSDLMDAPANKISWKYQVVHTHTHTQWYILFVLTVSSTLILSLITHVL